MLQPILTVNLTRRAISQFTVPAEWARDYLGAASLAARLLFNELTAQLDPLSPDAPLLFLNGPLTGTAGPAVGRFVVCGKSPATGLWAESNCGGFWGPELRKAGFDGVWIIGRADAPLWLWINDGEAELRDASHLWGLNPYEVQSAAAGELPAKNVRVASIGVAGEARIPFAAILCDHGRVAGRTGLGAVMGSKNLKAIAVKGTGDVPLIDWAAYKPVRAQANRDLRENNVTQVLKSMGTGAAGDYFNYIGTMPKKYYQSGVFEGAERATGAAMAETILSGVSACHACVIACGRVVTLADGAPRKGPEYETLAGFGPNLLIDDLAAITRLGELCDWYGMDTISASNITGLAFKLFDDGLITEADTGGVRLVWGSVPAAEFCVHAMARGTPFGRLLGLGARRLAAYFGAAQAAVQVNGLELAYHDPRGASGMALVYATSPRGGCHNQSDYFIVDLGQCEEDLGIPYYDRHAGAEKARNVARHQDWRTVGNALVLCQFANVPPKQVVELINTALGLDWTMGDLMRCGERGWNLKRLLNQRLGLTRQNDTLPKGMLEAYADGGAAGYIVPFADMLSAYYEARGWDPGTGMPTPAKREELGLEWAVSREP
jgi:aldehyde:ferredoxin oxidoreductase